MSRTFVAILAAALALSSTAGFAADAMKKPELTKEERTDMRNRADKLSAERSRMPSPADNAVAKTRETAAHKTTTPKAKPHKATTKKTAAHKTSTGKGTKSGKPTTPAVKKDEPKA